jgi:hypothetical protein
VQKLEKMRKILTITTMIMVFFSCGEENKSTQNKIVADIETFELTKTSKNQKPQDDSYKRFVNTEYRYNDTSGKSLIIQNSLPKGGLEYTDNNGENFVYAIFWTLIINETDNPFKLSIEFPATSFRRQDSPDNYFKIFVPKKKINFNNLSLLNFGIGDLGAILDDKLQKASSLQRTISPKNTSSFYVITLFNKGLEGPVRAGLSAKEDNLFYRLNQNEIHIGQVNIKNLTLTE